MAAGRGGVTAPHLLVRPVSAGAASDTEHRCPTAPRQASPDAALPVISAVEPYASRGARTVPGGEPPAREAPTRHSTLASLLLECHDEQGSRFEAKFHDFRYRRILSTGNVV